MTSERMSRPGKESDEAAQAPGEETNSNDTPWGYPSSSREDCNISPIRQYLKAIYGEHSGSAILAYGTNSHVNDKGKYRHGFWREVPFQWPEDAGDMEEGIRCAAQFGDVYVCTVLMSGHSRSPDDAVHLSVLHADVDSGGLDMEKVRLLGGFVVGSGSEGNGHVYVPLSRDVTPGEYEALERGLVRFLGADNKIAANDVLRPPGTLNHKPVVMNGGGGQPAEVQWVLPPNGTRMAPETVAELLGVSLTEPSRAEKPKRAKSRPAADARSEAVTDLDREVVTDLDQYPAVVEALRRDTGDRSKDTMRVVAACREAGLNLAQARWVVERRPDLVERLDGRADDDVARCWERCAPPSEIRLEDAYIGEFIADQHLAGTYVCASGYGWKKFDGRRWKSVSREVVAEDIRQWLIKFLQREAHARANHARLQQISRMLSASKIRAISYIVELRLTTDDQFDKHPHLLNVANGVVDLRTGVLGPHDPALMLTTLCPTNYLPDAKHPDWDHALEAVPDDAVDWMQVRFGQGITGHPPPDDKLLILNGGGANGKSCLIDGVRCCLGSDYVVVMPDRVLLARPGDHPTEMMSLRGARLALMEELPEGGHLNAKRVKDILGVGKITARYCGKDSVWWTPTHTPVVTSNYMPRVDESDTGTWRRLLMLTFPYTYLPPGTPPKAPYDREGDPGLRERLRQGGEGRHEAVLAWLVEGAVRCYQDGQRMPDDPQSVQQATQRWRGNADLLLRYIRDRLVFDTEAQVMATELFEDFRQWLSASGHTPWSDQTFSARFSQHGEVLGNQVDHKRARQSDKIRLSRPPRERELFPVVAEPPAQFKAWVGVRFKTATDDGADQP